MEIVRKEYSFKSTTGVADIYAQSWAPANSEDVIGIFQIVHGMAEYSVRYEKFANFLCTKGFAVFINDHIGHGKSVNSDDELGYFGEKDGYLGFVNDARVLTEMAMHEYPDKPVIFFGHSMGSFVARKYTQEFGDRIAGAIYCGTSGANPATGIAVKLADIIAARYGSMHRSEFINKLAFGSYNKKINPPRTPFDWLSVNTENVDKYIADPYCGFLFTAKGYKDLFMLLNSVSKKDWFKSIPYSLPIYITSGAMDPVGEYGKGVKQVYDDLKKTGHTDVTLKIYDGLRHEILNEEKIEVFEDIANWCLGVVEKQPK